MKLIDLIIIGTIPLAIICITKFVRLYCMGIDEILTDISDSVNGRYKSKYKGSDNNGA